MLHFRAGTQVQGSAITREMGPVLACPDFPHFPGTLTHVTVTRAASS